MAETKQVALLKNGSTNPPELRGNTLRTYLQVLKHGPCELRDVQHELGLSTPSLASYHLGKLVEAGYVKQDEQSRYMASSDAVGNILEGYSKIGTTIVPQLSFSAVLFTILIGYFSFEALYVPSFIPYLVIVSLATAVLLWFETFRLWRKFAP